MSAQTAERRTTLLQLQKRSREGEKLVMLTCYDASFARLCDEAGVDMLLIGDSLGMVIQGHDSTLAVTLEQTVYHVECVVRGSSKALVIADMPFGSFQESPGQAFRSCARVMAAGELGEHPLREPVAAISVGIVNGAPALDLPYIEDANADVDMNVVMTGAGRFVEVQGTAEGVAFTRDELDQLLALAEGGIKQIFDLQAELLSMPPAPRALGR